MAANQLRHVFRKEGCSLRHRIDGFERKQHSDVRRDVLPDLRQNGHHRELRQGTDDLDIEAFITPLLLNEIAQLERRTNGEHSLGR